MMFTYEGGQPAKPALIWPTDLSGPAKPGVTVPTSPVMQDRWPIGRQELGNKPDNKDSGFGSGKESEVLLWKEG